MNPLSFFDLPQLRCGINGEVIRLIPDIAKAQRVQPRRCGLVVTTHLFRCAWWRVLRRQHLDTQFLWNPKIVTERTASKRSLLAIKKNWRLTEMWAFAFSEHPILKQDWWNKNQAAVCGCPRSTCVLSKTQWSSHWRIRIIYPRILAARMQPHSMRHFMSFPLLCPLKNLLS